MTCRRCIRLDSLPQWNPCYRRQPFISCDGSIFNESAFWN